MNLNNQIEELAIELSDIQNEYDKAWHECLHNGGQHPEKENLFYAKRLVDKGYRKASEVAREIFEEIESRKIFLKDHAGNIGIVVRLKDIAELKKKYIGKDTNVTTNTEEERKC